MTKIGELFSLGLESLNSSVYSYTGRRFPLSRQELKSNVSNNVATCGKMCSLLLDSSFGLACAMGVVGLTTASVCAGEDVAEVIVEVLTDNTSTSEIVLLCFKKHIDVGGHFEPWHPGSYDICGNPPVEVDCDAMMKQGLGNKGSIKPECVDIGHYLYERSPHHSYPNNDAEVARHNHSMQVHWMADIYVKALVKGATCLTESVFYVANQTKGEVIKLDDLSLGVCKSSNPGTSADLDPFCFPKTLGATYLHMDPYGSPDNCSAPFHVPATNLIEAADVCDSCNYMVLAFGVGSALTLMTTIIGKIYTQYKRPEAGVPKKVKRALVNLVNNGLLLWASGVGSGVLMHSLIEPCSPVGEDVRAAIAVSTALYGASAFSRLLENVVTRPLAVESTPEEKGKGGLSVAI